MNFIMLQPAEPRHERHPGPPGDGHGRQLPSSTPRSSTRVSTPRRNQPFVPGTPYYVADAGYPAYNPTKAKALVQQVESETGKPVAFTLAVDQLGVRRSRRSQFLQSQFQARRDEGAR